MMRSSRRWSSASAPESASKISPFTASTAPQHALAAVAVLVAVAPLHRLVGAGRGAGRHGGAAQRAVLQHHVHLDGRIAPAVEDLAREDVDDLGHGALQLILGEARGLAGAAGRGQPAVERPGARTSAASATGGRGRCRLQVDVVRPLHAAGVVFDVAWVQGCVRRMHVRRSDAEIVRGDGHVHGRAVDRARGVMNRAAARRRGCGVCLRDGAHTSRLCSSAAAMKLANSGCGANGRLFSSGWNCTPMNQGWSVALDDLGQHAVGRDAGHLQAGALERLAIADVDLVAVAVALADRGRAVDLARPCEPGVSTAS